MEMEYNNSKEAIYIQEECQHQQVNYSHSTAGTQETLETVAAKGTSTAVGASATSEILATTRLQGRQHR
jgi:hypothetical protein